MLDSMPDVPAVTQRAYLLRLRPADRSQLDALWTTHEAVNRGAQWFGDWLLTLRASLGAEAISSASDAEQRRVLLSLCWFTVEDERGAPPKYIICRARESAAARAHTLCERLRTRLRAFSSLDNETIEQWVAGCRSTFAAHIRDDAVWVDRAQAFEDTGWPRSEAAKIVKQLLGDAAEFLTPLADGDAVDSDDAPASNKARGWLSKHWGSGEKSDRAHIARTLEQMCEAAHRVPWDRPGVDILRDILKHIGHELAPQQRPEDKIAEIVGWRGRPSAGRIEIRRLQDLPHATEQDRGRFCEKLRGDTSSDAVHSSASSMADAIRSQVEEAVGMPFRGERDHIGEYSTMLDHAIRRVMAHFSWIRRADAKRRTFENDAKRMQHVSPEIRKFLDEYIAHRTQASGAGEEGYRLRLAAVAGWEKVHKAWRELKSAEERKLAAREQQALATELDEKFGDIVLFEALAEDAAAPIRDAPAEALLDYVKASIAAYDAQRFKVPAYRHPDPLRHPVFVEFGNSRWEIRFLVQDALRKESSRPRQEVSQNLAQRRTVRLDLWSGINIQRVDIRWQGQRFVDDLALDRLLQSAQATEQSNPEPGPPTIAPRADRLGIVASGCPAPEIPFLRKKEWNGRLQVPRSDLLRLMRAQAKTANQPSGNPASSTPASELLEKVRWYLTVSVECQPAGPWHRYAESHRDLQLPLDTRRPIFGDINKHRGKQAKLLLCRLPHLRILSIDLGLRHAAAAAVWETCSSAEVAEVARRHGLPQPSSEDHFLMVKEGQRRIWYRRIAADHIEGKPHPAAWARLERQFLIKVPGEDIAPRKASPYERALLAKAMSVSGRTAHDEKEALKNAGLSASADAVEVRTAILRELRRWQRCQRRRAMLVWAMATTSDYGQRQLPGGRVETVSLAQAKAHLTDQLLEFYDLTCDDPKIADVWHQHIVPLGGPALSEGGERRLSPQQEEHLRTQLQPIAESLLAVGRRQPLVSALEQVWHKDQPQITQLLRDVRDLLIPPSGSKHRHLRGPTARHVGGLSLSRIALLTELYRAMRSHRMAPRPDTGPQRASKEDPDLPFARAVLAERDHLREQRIRVIASRIVEAALGVGATSAPQTILDAAGKRKGLRWFPRPTLDNDKKHDAVHAVVIENLEHYRPDEGRLRRENRALMEWSARNLRDWMHEACYLYGLRVVEISPAYTSRIDSRRGGFGLRCREVLVEDWLRDPRATALANPTDDPAKWTEEQRFFHELWRRAQSSPKKDARLLVPQRGGDLFVSAASGLGPLQADLNAAANIGWKALCDPDWQGRWLYVPCNAQTGKADPQAVKGTPEEWWRTPLLSAARTKPSERRLRRSAGTPAREENIVNAWRGDAGAWVAYDKHWQQVAQRVYEHLLDLNTRRLTATTQ